jgi:hypothetical protein
MVLNHHEVTDSPNSTTVGAGETISNVIERLLGKKSLTYPELVVGSLLLQSENIDSLKNVNVLSEGAAIKAPRNYSKKVQDVVNDPELFKEAHTIFKQQYSDFTEGKLDYLHAELEEPVALQENEELETSFVEPIELHENEPDELDLEFQSDENQAFLAENFRKLDADITRARHFSDMINPELMMPVDTVTQEVLERTQVLDKETLEEYQNQTFEPGSIESWQTLGVVLAVEFPEGVEDIIRLLFNLPAAAVLIGPYQKTRKDLFSAQMMEKLGYDMDLEIAMLEMKQDFLVKNNPVLEMLDLVGVDGLKLIVDVLYRLNNILQGQDPATIGEVSAALHGVLAIWKGGAGATRFVKKVPKYAKRSNVAYRKTKRYKRMLEKEWGDYKAKKQKSNSEDGSPSH